LALILVIAQAITIANATVTLRVAVITITRISIISAITTLTAGPLTITQMTMTTWEAPSDQLSALSLFAFF
jgi:hypothetical protein